MRWEQTVLLVAGVAALVAWLVWVNGSRLDRLHRRVGASRAVLEAQLMRRAAVAAELATGGLLDPVSSVIVGDAAWAALEAGGEAAGGQQVPTELAALLATGPNGPVRAAPDGPDGPGGIDRSQVESELSATLREVLNDAEEVAELHDDPTGGEVLEELAAAWYRVQLARRFHNDAVTQTRAARRSVFVRVLRLAGSAPEPVTLELDDAWPAGLAHAAAGQPAPGSAATGAEAAAE